MWTAKLLFLFLSGCAVSALICRRLSTMRGWAMDEPDSVRKLHPAPVPRTGGLAIFLGMMCGLPLIVYWNPDFLREWWTVLLCCLLMFSVGFADDLKAMGARIKLTGQIVVALIAYALGLSIDRISNPLSEGMAWELGALSLPVTVFWLVALPNIVNLIDGMDGLAGGVSLFMCAILAMMGSFVDYPTLAQLALLTGGATLGFLFYNFPPARIFLGDGGAYFLGFFIASSSLNTSNKGSIVASILVVMIGLGVPILDTLFAILRRVIRGVPIFRADVDHIHHRLLQVGYSKRKALWAIYAVCAVLSLIGISLLWARGISLPVTVAALGLLAFILVTHLGYITSWSGLKKQTLRALAQRRITQRAVKHGQMLELELDYCESAEEYWQLFRNSLSRLGFQFESFEGCGKLTLRGDGAAWDLYYPNYPRDESNWSRVAGCFQQPFVVAQHRFPTPDSHS